MWELYLQKKKLMKCSVHLNSPQRGPRMTGFSGIVFPAVTVTYNTVFKAFFFLLLLLNWLGNLKIENLPKKNGEKKNQGHLLILKLPPLGVLVGILVWMIFYQDTCFFVWSPCLNPNQGWLPVQCFQVSRAKSFSSRCRTVWNGRTVRWLVGSGRNNT